MQPDNLPELLAEHGIYPKSMAAGRTDKIRCPNCGGGRTRELSLSLKIDEDGMGAAWQCHRGKCGWRGGGRIKGAPGAPRPVENLRIFQRPAEHREAEIRRPAAMYAWFEARGIGQETVDAFGIYITRRWFPEHGEQDALVFPYLFRGEVVNRKYRPPQKNPQLQERDALPTLFNIDAVEAPDELIWVEGEPDVMALWEAGYRQVVTLKDGAGDRLRDEDDPAREADKRFFALRTHEELLQEVQKVILAGDMDEPGKVLREELARRLGRERCWTVAWPEGCKDAGDTLKAHGVEVVRRCIEGAAPYPIEGLQSVSAGMMVDLWDGEPPPTLTTGCEATDAIMALPSEGRLIIVTGIPNHGKSSWTMFVSVHLMKKHRRRFLVFTPEMQPAAEYVGLCAQILVGKPLRGPNRMSREEAEKAGAYLQGRMTLVSIDAEHISPTLDWVLQMTRIAVYREGVTDLLIDPWNEMEHARGDISETEYVGLCLQRLRAFTVKHGINVWIVAHPTKQMPAKPGDKIAAPDLYAINGSANWANKADVGITIHTPDSITEVHLKKSRFQRWVWIGME